MINQSLLDILVCPESHQSLQVADEALVAGLNGQIKASTLKNIKGERVLELLDGALLRSDKSRCYPIRQDIPVLLVEEGIPL